MSEINWHSIDLGPIDAYAEAVEAGYTGTREEWLLEVGSVKENAEAAEDSAEAAEDSAEAAAGSATSAAASAAEAAQYTSTAVHTWLENNIDPDSGYALDRTLSEPLEAAPADLVGDLKSAVNNIDAEVFADSEETALFSNVAGRVINASGEVISYSNNAYGVTSNIDVTNYYKIKVTAGAGYSCYYYAFYDANDAFVSGEQAPSNTSASITAKVVEVPANASYVVAAHYTNLTNAVIGVKKVSNIETMQDEMSEILTTYDVYTQLPYTMNNGKLLYADGSVNDYSNQGYGVSSEIDISGYDSLTVTGGAGYGNLVYAFYNDSHTFISGYQSPSNTSITLTNEPATIPENAVYIRAAKHSSVTVSVNGVESITKTEGVAKWAGKKWVVIGDSLTEHNTRTTKNYHDYIATETGITVVNMGVSGTGYRNGGTGSNPFYSRVANVPTDADVVTIFGSFNDGLTDLGTATDTGTTTIGGCINTTIDNLYTVLPTVQLGIVSPTPWVGANPYNHSEADAYPALLEAICKRRSIPFLNLYYESNLRPWDSSFLPLAYSKDGGNGVHPDETGHKLIASRFEGFLDTLLLS